MGLDIKWIGTVDDAITNPAWDEYDSTLKTEAEGYNVRLAATPGYRQVDWNLFKAVLWVESGGPTSKEWKRKVMQIGNPGDAAYGVVKNGLEGSSILMAPSFRHDLQVSGLDSPEMNIKAAILYIMTRFASFAVKSVLDSIDQREYAYTVVAGDSLERIAAKVGTTVEVLKAMNPGAVKTIHPKQTLKYKKAAMKTVITGWTFMDPASLARLYNGGGDPTYAEKLNYVLSLFGKLKT